MVLVDGQGIAHPRGLGLATHLGLVADMPTIGVAKSRLVGEGNEPELAAGSYKPLIWKGKQVGLILRTRQGINPLYVSPGHRITLPECLEITLGCVTRYRLPLPVRQADLLSRRLRPRPWPEALGRPADGGGVEEPLPVQRADVISRVAAPLLAGIPLPPETILANSPDLLVEANSSHIPEIDHQPISP